MKTKKKISIKNLNTDQKKFIESKVKELKTIEAVKLFYRFEDAVSVFAIQTAKKLKIQTTNNNTVISKDNK